MPPGGKLRKFSYVSWLQAATSSGGERRDAPDRALNARSLFILSTEDRHGVPAVQSRAEGSRVREKRLGVQNDNDARAVNRSSRSRFTCCLTVRRSRARRRAVSW